MSQPGFPPWAEISPGRRAHTERVIALLRQWANARGTAPVEYDRWVKAAYFHDALKDAAPERLLEIAPNPWGIPALHHGPAAAALAERDGERDRGVLDAVRFHSVGYAGWDDVGRMLYLADFLDPGRRHDAGERDILAERVAADPRSVLREVARRRIEWHLRQGHPLLPETVEFWNSLCCAV